ncbi:MAG: hypothetical protein GY930_15175, partial [bacterium]|nr:hypothetical protein [bacterium]
MSQRCADQGLVIIGVHTSKGGKKMAEMAKSSAIPYPLAVDSNKVTKATFAVDRYPDYYLIERAGNLRVADLSNGDLERAVKVLLAEKAGDALHPSLAKASAKAKQKDKRLLAMWGSTTDVASILKFAKTTKGLRKLIYNEYEIIHLTLADRPLLAKAHGITTDGPTLAVLDADGKLLQTKSATDLTGELYANWLEQNWSPSRMLKCSGPTPSKRPKPATGESSCTWVHPGEAGASSLRSSSSDPPPQRRWPKITCCSRSTPSATRTGLRLPCASVAPTRTAFPEWPSPI